MLENIKNKVKDAFDKRTVLDADNLEKELKEKGYATIPAGTTVDVHIEKRESKKPIYPQFDRMYLPDAPEKPEFLKERDRHG